VTAPLYGITPVIFLPGILGSSKGGGGAYPILSEEPPSWDYQDWDTKSWGLHDPASKAGWRDLYNYFHRNNQAYELGCTVFPAPYDWRMDIDEASQKYLEKVINYAKVRSGVGRVDIVAHSMGGLLARSYLQNGLDHRRIQVLPVAGGWLKAITHFEENLVTSLRTYRNGRVVLVVDFDDNFEDRLKHFKEAIPKEFKDRVFVIGVLSEPEKLKVSLGSSFEKIGLSLAKDCVDGTSDTWGHELLAHNKLELDRMIKLIKPFLFTAP
jgi:Lecithin:cholesterol acyltransferase